MNPPPLRPLFSGIPALCLSALLFSCAGQPKTLPQAPSGKPLTRAELPALRREFLEAMQFEPEILYVKTPSLIDRKENWHALEQWYALDILQMVPRQDQPGWADCHIRFKVVDNHGRKRTAYEWRKLGVTHQESASVVITETTHRFCDPRIKSVNKTDGLSFQVREIIAGVEKCVKAG